MASTKRCIMTSQDIERSLARIALQILEQAGPIEDLALIGIHTGGVYLAERIRKIIAEQEGVELPIATLDITLYRDDWSLVSMNPIVRKTNIPFKVEEKIVVLVDDVLFTGRTIRAALDAIMDYGRPKRIELAVLVDRGGRELPIQANYSGLDQQVEAGEHVHVLLQETGHGDEVILEKTS